MNILIQSKIFRSRIYIVVFLITGFLAFGGFTFLPGLLGDLIPILNYPDTPIFNISFSLCFSIVVISGLIYYYISEKRRSLDDINSPLDT